jgi:hypothetical protein
VSSGCQWWKSETEETTATGVSDDNAQAESEARQRTKAANSADHFDFNGPIDDVGYPSNQSEVS